VQFVTIVKSDSRSFELHTQDALFRSAQSSTLRKPAKLSTTTMSGVAKFCGVKMANQSLLRNGDEVNVLRAHEELHLSYEHKLCHRKD
jgi:hypothetical protein